MFCADKRKLARPCAEKGVDFMNAHAKKNGVARRILSKPETPIILITLGFIAFFQVFNREFLSAVNVFSILKTMSFYGLIAIGETMLLCGGDIDISMGAVCGMGAIVSTKIMKDTSVFGMLNTSWEWFGVLLICLITVLICGCVGVVSATFVVKLRLPPFVATIATQYAARGVVNILTNGIAVYPLPTWFAENLGQAQILVTKTSGFSLVFLLFIALAIVFEFILRRTRFGRGVMAIGANIEVARIMGIPTEKYRYINFILNAMLAAVSGILMAAFIKQGYAGIGLDMEMTIIAGVLIGGVSLSGGSGSMIGITCGVLLMYIINTGLTMIGFNTFLQIVVQGVLIMIAVYIDRLRLSKKIRA